MKNYDTVRKAQEEASNGLDVPNFREAVNITRLDINWPDSVHLKAPTINKAWVLLAFCAEISVIIWITKCT